MKLALALIVTSLTIQASASELRTPCKFDDYQKISSALLNVQIIQGAQLVDEVESLLQQEMGPSCVEVSSLEPTFSIPGSKFSVYEITSASEGFKVVISENRVEFSGNSVSITRK